jgi:Acetoacetate decarboxylase (ADC)
MLSYAIQDRTVTLPVEIRDAAACSALFAVPAEAAQSVIAYSGLRVVRPLPGRALCSLAFIRYADGDLGPYHEFAVGFAVENNGVFIHWLPVNQTFTLEAGRRIWGFPKEPAEIDIDLAGSVKRCTVRQDGRLVADLRIAAGPPLPVLPTLTGSGVDAYSCLDGVTRRTPWTMAPHGLRGRPGGARLMLGRHRVADELRALGLPRRAVASATIPHVSMHFDAAQEL